MLGKTLKQARISAGLSQVGLAAVSGVSLPTIQNIERNKANPSLATIEAIGKEVGLELILVRSAVDWSFLIHAGLPLTSNEPRSPIPPVASEVLRELRKLPHSELTARERKAVAGLLMAIECHYPSFARKVGPALMDVFRDDFNRPEILKLKRLATARLADWL